MVLEGRNGSRRVARMKSKSGNGTRGKNERRNDEWKNDEKFRADRIRVPFELDYEDIENRARDEGVEGVDSG